VELWVSSWSNQRLFMREQSRLSHSIPSHACVTPAPGTVGGRPMSPTNVGNGNYLLAPIRDALKIRLNGETSHTCRAPKFRPCRRRKRGVPIADNRVPVETTGLDGWRAASPAAAIARQPLACHSEGCLKRTRLAPDLPSAA
jgi:hypothetical protein